MLGIDPRVSLCRFASHPYHLPASLFPFHYVVCFVLFMCVRSCCRRASMIRRAHHGSATARQSSKASTCRLERDNASRQMNLARANMSWSIYTARSLCQTERRHRNLPGLQKYNWYMRVLVRRRSGHLQVATRITGEHSKN